jgi:hypothetical protein
VNYALAGLVTGNAAYKNKAIALAMLHCSRGYDAISHTRTGYGSHGGVREIVPAVAVCYDWLHADLSAAQRDKMAEWLVNWGNLCWPETQPADMRSLYGRDHPGDNFYWGFMVASMLAGLALTARPGSGSIVGRPLLEIARRRFATEALPHKQRYEPQGFPKEGSSYGVQSWMNCLLTLDAVKSMTGEDLWPGAALLVNQYLLHMTTPDMQRLLLVGDNARITASKGQTLMPLDDYVKALALIAQNHVPATESPTSFAWWLQSIKPMPPGGWTLEAFADSPPAYLSLPAGIMEHPDYLSDPPEAFAGAFAPPSPFPWLAYLPVLYARPELRETCLTMLHSGTLASPANGFAVSRQESLTLNEARTDTMLHFQAGQHLESHEDKAPGSILIYKDGELLIGSARHWSGWGAIGDGRGAEHHSTLLLPPHHVSEPAWKADVPEPLKRAHESIRLTRSVSADSYLYLEGSLAGAYAFKGDWHADPEQWVKHPLKKWRRMILWHRVHDLFLFIDEIEKEPWAAQPVIAWQVREEPSIINGWGIAVGDWAVHGDIFSQGHVTTADRVGNSWRVLTRFGDNGGLIMNALQVIPRAGVVRTPHYYEKNGALGVIFGSGAEAVTLAVQTGDAPPPVSKRLYRLENGSEFANWDLFAAGLKPYLERKDPDSTTVSSRLENAQPRPEGEMVLIPRQSA